MIIRSWDRKPVTIYGKIVVNEDKLIDFDVEIKPNFGFILFILITIILPIIHLFQQYPNGKIEILGLLICPFFMILIWIGAFYTVAYYKEEFEKAFDLEPIVNPISSRIRL
jgi:hypothetical protein